MDEIDIVKVDSISDGELMKNDVRAFTLNNSQLFRFKIYDTNDGVVLFSDFHHIITDGVSQNMFFNEIVSVYNGEDIERETVDGYVYSLIEEKLVDGEKYNQSKKFFQDKMVDEVESTVLTPNLNGNPDEGKIKNVSDSIDSKVVKKFCKDNVVSQNALFLIKTLPIIISNENRQETIKEFIKHVDKTWKDTINHSNYPYTKIAEEFQLKPEFLYSYQEFLEDVNLSIGNKTFESYELVDDDFAGTEYKIDMTITEYESSININIGYNDQLYTKEYIEQFIGSIKRIISQFIENDIDKLRICDVELESESDIPEFSPIELPFMHKRFEMQVEANPDNVVLVAEDAIMTADELNQKANKIANALIKKGVHQY